MICVIWASAVQINFNGHGKVRDKSIRQILLKTTKPIPIRTKYFYKY
jgi:hypothetical protein